MSLFPPTNMLGIVVALGLMFVVALGFHALGLWLRRRGHGQRLDAIDTAVTAAQRRSLRLLGPLAISVARFGRAFHTLPLVGSRRQREVWGDFESERRREATEKAPKNN